MGNNELVFRKLRADEVEARVGTCSEKGFTLLLYKDARCDMRILDEQVGAFNWQRDHREIKGNLYCGVGIFHEERWVWKWDCGTESNTEKEKGEASDSFKRACFNWGIGRELYTSPFIWIAGNTEKNGARCVPTIKSFKVVKLGYDAEGKINLLQIQGGKDIIFDYDHTKGQISHDRPKTEQTHKENTNNGANEPTYEQACNQRTNGGVRFDDLNDADLNTIIVKSTSDWYVKCATLVLESRQAPMENEYPWD